MMVATYTGHLQIDLTKLGETKYSVPQSDRIWLPKNVVVNGAVFVNPTDAVIQIRYTEESADGDVWAIKDGFRNTESGPFHQVLVTVITPGAGTKLVLMLGKGVAGGYGSSDGLSPVIGLAAQSQSNYSTDSIMTVVSGR